jgi:uncharacterized protein YlxW (UPF0749 family)
MKHFQESLSETKQIALSAKRKALEPHICIKVDKFNEINDTLKSMRVIKISAVIAFLGLIVAAVAQYYGFKNTVDNNSAALVEVKNSIENLNESQRSMEKKFVTYEVQVAESKNIVDTITDLIENQPIKKKKKKQ